MKCVKTLEGIPWRGAIDHPLVRERDGEYRIRSRVDWQPFPAEAAAREKVCRFRRMRRHCCMISLATDHFQKDDYI